uniref:Uncharacterized protein n=1 Tax=Araucaria cunninghamii TaxID=56994 RepID=A0A0D6R0X4_ARACU
MSSATLHQSLYTGRNRAIPGNHQRHNNRNASARNTVRASSAPNHRHDVLDCWKKGFRLISSDNKKSMYLGGTLGIGITTGIVLQLATPSGGGIGEGWIDGWGGGGDGGGNFWSRITAALAEANKEEEDLEDWDPHGMIVGLHVPLHRFSPFIKYKLSGIDLYDDVSGSYRSSKDSFYELFTLRPGGVYTKAHFQAEYDNLAKCGMFQEVEMEGVCQADGTIKLLVSFKESMWGAAKEFRCINVGLYKPPPREFRPDMDKDERREWRKQNERDYQMKIAISRPCMLPESETDEITRWLKSERRVTASMLQKIRDHVQKWYHDQGYACAQVVNFGNLNTKEIVCEVVEGDITKVEIQFQDKMGNVCEGNTKDDVILRELPRRLSTRNLFNINDGRRALQNVNSLGLFSNIEINPKPDEANEGGIIVEVKLKELEQKTAEVSTEWSIVPGSGGRPHLASIVPGGNVTFEHRNLQGLNRSIVGTVTSNNLFNPQDDLGFKMEYIHPSLDGVADRTKDRTLRASCFNSRKLSPVFTGGPGLEEVPAIWVDRAGFKSNITENFSRQNKFTYGVVLEEITTRDETSTVCANGARALPSGALSMDGPPTTLSGTGIDRMAFLQANITLDNTEIIDGNPVGHRDVFQVDQGLGIGSKFPFFNRHQITKTRFIRLRKLGRYLKGAVPVMVLHGHYGGCIGDLPSYDAFPLGGPYSVRGYNMGELGACRNILELAGEVRLPVRNVHTYAFAEYGTDLGSSKYVKGNPTEFFRRAGHGASYGVGVKFGLIRAEYAVDHNVGSGSILVRFGERF